MIRRVLILIAFLMMFGIAKAGDMTILTENYPPFNYEHDGEIKGLAVGIVQSIMGDIGWDSEIKRLSWNRAYEMISTEPGYILFSMARIEKREDKFKWVGPLYKIPGYYYKKKGRVVSVNSIDDIKENASVGVRENSNIHHSFIEEGFKKLVPMESPESLYRGLYYERLDLIITSPWNLPFRAKKYDLPFDAFERTSVRAGTGTLYIAFSKQTPDDVITLWQNSLDKLKASGEFDKLTQKNLGIVSQDYDVKFDLPKDE